MPKFQLFENDKPADWPGAKHPDTSIHNSWKEVVEYADHYLGIYSPGMETLHNIGTRKKFDYSGYNDCIEFRCVEQ